VLVVSLCAIFAGFVNQVMKISFNPSEAVVGLHERASLVLPQYVLLTTSLILCFWIPDSLYRTIIDAVTSAAGGF
jgi:hydrogenase-4 component F